MKFLKNASLKYKLLITVFIVVFMLIAVITTQNINELHNRMNTDLEKELESVGLLTAMNLDSGEIKKLLTAKGEDDADFLKVQNQLNMILEEQGTMSWSYIGIMENGGINPIGYTSNMNEIFEPGEVLSGLAPKHVEMAELAITHNHTEVTDIYEDPFGTWRSVYSPIADENGEIIALLGIDYSAEYIDTIIKDSVFKQLAIAAIGLVVLLAVLYIVIDRLLKPLEKLVGVANQVANGELKDVELEVTHDEIGKLSESVKTMVSNLQHVILNIRNTSNHVSSAANQLSTNAVESYNNSTYIAKDMDQINQNAEASLIITEETAAAMEETAFGIHQIAESANTAAESSVSASKASEQGDTVVQQVIAQMQLIN